MPYSSVSEIIERFPKLKKYPEVAQKMFLKVVNAALKEYPDDEGKAIATAWAAINKKYGKQDQDLKYSMTQNAFSCNINEHDDVMDIPTVFTREGVQNNAFKPWDEIKKGASTLKGKPVVLGHPSPSRPVSPALDKYVGKVIDIDPRDSDRALHGTVRIYTDEAPSWFLNALRNCEMRSGSPGFWRIPDATFGTFKGKSYTTIERNLQFDHFAVGIPKGACPVSEGCGLGFNESQDGEEKPLSLDTLKGEVTVCWDKLKEFIVDVFMRNREESIEEENSNGSEEKMEINEEERARIVAPFETKIRELETAKKEIEDAKTEVETAKTKLEEELQGFKDKETEHVEKQREQLVKEIIEHTEEEADTYKDWTPTQLTHLRTKLVKGKREELIKPILELTEEEAKAYENYSIGQLEHLHKVIGLSKTKAEKATDKKALAPPGGEGEAYAPSFAVAGTKLTIGDLSDTKPGE